MRFTRPAINYAHAAIHAFGAVCVFIVLFFALYKSSSLGKQSGIEFICHILDHQLSRSSVAHTDPFSCAALRDHGSWVFDFPSLSTRDTISHWQPPGCMLHTYVARDLAQCISSGSLTFLGDSLARSLFWATAQKLDNFKAVETRRSTPKHTDITFRVGQVQLHFVWDPYLNGTWDFEIPPELLQDRESGTWFESGEVADSLLVISTGLWHARYSGSSYMDSFKAGILNILERPSQQRNNESHYPPALALTQANSATGGRDNHQARARGSLAKRKEIFLPVPIPDMDSLTPERAITLTADRILPLNAHLQLQADQGAIELLRSFGVMTQSATSAFDDSGIHLRPNVAVAVSDVLLNLHCNRQGTFQHYPFDKTCCAPAPPVNSVQVFLLLTAMALLTWRLRMSLVQDDGGETPVSNHRKFHAISIIALVIFYSFSGDRSSTFAKINKTIHEPRFLFLTFSTLLLGVASIAKSRNRFEILEDTNDHATACICHNQPFLSRSQTDEWKGWMQMIILLYHYFGMSRIVWVYRIVRLLVSSYLFMTGFGHTSYFLRTNDFSLQRLSAVLFRLNVLSVMLAYVMRTDYSFYYFPALCSFWFIIVAITLGVSHQSLPACRFLWIRIPFSALLTGFILRYPGLLELICTALRTVCKMSINVDEFRFRVCLDFYIVYVGMVFGWLYIQSNWWRPNTRIGGAWKRYQQHITAQRFTLIGSAAVVVAWCVIAHQSSNKFDYNSWHPTTSPIPVIAFVILRNATQWLRNHHMQIFAWLGQCSLETFILQYHIWLAGDTKGLLYVGLGGSRLPDPISFWVEFALLTTVLLWASWVVSKATIALTESFVRKPNLVSIPQLPSNSNSEEIWYPSRIITQIRAGGLISTDLPSRITIFLLFLLLGNWIWEN